MRGVCELVLIRLAHVTAPTEARMRKKLTCIL